MSEETKCLPQLVEIVQKIPSTAGQNCSGTYRIETPLLISTWEPDSVQVSIVNSVFRCSGTNAVVNGSAIDITFGGSGGGNVCATPYFHDAVWTTTCINGASDAGTFPNCPTSGIPLSAVLNPGGNATVQVLTSSNVTATGCWSPVTCSNIVAFTSYGITNVRKQNPNDPDCEDTVTVRYEGCSKGAPPGTYNATTPPPGGGSSGGGGSPGGSPPPNDPPPSPPPQPPSGGFGGNGGGGSPPPPSGVNPPPAPPSVSPPPQFSPQVAQPSGNQIIYPGNVVLTPAPEPEFPTLTAILPGSDPEQLPWSGYAVYPGSATPGNVVVGATFPALYVSPMMAQRVFHNWKTLKHVLLQFDNSEGVDIHTTFTTTSQAMFGKALKRFNANVGIIYNDEMSDQIIQELYRYDPLLWSNVLFLKHFSPKQLDRVVSFKEALLGTSYSYQIAVYSSDANTWKLVGWQIEGKTKGKRRNHGRD